MIATAEQIENTTNADPSASADITKIAAALVKAQASIGRAAKDATNPHFNKKYADLASVMDACQEALAANEIAVIQMPTTIAEGVRIETVLLHSSGQRLSSSLTMPLEKRTSQGIGSAITYGRRYALAAMVGVAPEDDDGHAAERDAPRGNGNGRRPHQQPRNNGSRDQSEHKHILKIEEELKAIMPAWTTVFAQKPDAKAAYWAWVQRTLSIEKIADITLDSLQQLRHAIDAKDAENNKHDQQQANPISELCDLWAQKTYRTPGDKQTKLAFLDFARAVLKQPKLKGGDLAQLNDDGVTKLQQTVDNIDMTSDLVMGVAERLPKEGDATLTMPTGEVVPKFWVITTEKNGRMACVDESFASLATTSEEQGDALALAFFHDGTGNRLVGCTLADADQQGASADAGASDVAEY